MSIDSNPRAKRVMLIGMVFLLIDSLNRLLTHRFVADFQQGVVEGVTIGLYLIAISLLVMSMWMRRRPR